MFESDEAEVDMGVGVGVEVRGCGSGGFLLHKLESHNKIVQNHIIKLCRIT